MGVHAQWGLRCKPTVSDEPNSRARFPGSCMLLVVSAVKLVAEIALMALLGQWLLGLLAGPKRETNMFYQTLGVLTKPFVKGMRLITPRVVIDRHVPLATGLLLFTVWVAATLTKINLCVEIGVQACQ